ncbi:NTP transferase domain-containing protein [Candidatus Saccharibacteria bacterium TM7i]|nr:NTP transferase domain-containing protein [Candidatus Saccharibacteria bacterium TM7i]
MKGIVLAAGKGTRMGATTLGIGGRGAAVSKPLLPTYDKPTIYYSLSSLIAAGIREILIIAAPDNVEQFRNTIGDGNELGMEISYAVQPKPRGIAEAFIIGADFIGDSDVALTFGDNIFNGHRFTETLRKSTQPNGATIFAYHVPNPQDFGVVKFDKAGQAISLEEKPVNPKSSYAVPGIYFYSPDVVDIASMVQPSDRGELEITSVNELYLRRGRLHVSVLDSDTDWFDTGNPESLHEAATFVRNYQEKTGRLLGSPEAEAYRAGFITTNTLMDHGIKLQKSDYGQSLIRLAEGKWDI